MLGGGWLARSPVHRTGRKRANTLGKQTKVTAKRPTTTKIYQIYMKTTKIALARSPVAKSGPDWSCPEGCWGIQPQGMAEFGGVEAGRHDIDT